MNTPDFPFMQHGWLCPRCNVVNGPMTPSCYLCAPAGSQVTKDTTGNNPTKWQPQTIAHGIKETK